MFKFYSILLLYICLVSCKQNCTIYTNDESVFGIDVSHYQDDKESIKWDKVKQNIKPKIDFVYIRTTMGKNGSDNSFKQNIIELEKLNITYGVYHYFRPNELAIEQFKNFKKHNNKFGKLSIAVDVEEKSNFSNKIFKKELRKFLELIEKEYNTKPIIYSPQKFFNLYLWQDFKDYKFWIARQHGIKTIPKNNTPGKIPKLLSFKCPVIWQYSGTGNVSGINSKVDLNITSKSIFENQLSIASQQIHH